MLTTAIADLSYARRPSLIRLNGDVSSETTTYVLHGRRYSMGNCCASCYKGSSSYEDLTPDRETIRRKQAEAAERRIAEQQQRGIKDVESVKRQQRRALELEKREQEAAASGTQPTLRWQVQ